MKLSLRDLLWLTTVAACLCGWWREHRRVDQADAAFQRLSADRALWVERAKDARDILSNQGYVLTYYTGGIGLESKERASNDDGWIEIAGELAMPDPVAFPE